MAYRSTLRVPFGYGRDERTLEQVRTWLLVHHHPEYVERLVAWLDAQDGHIGPGGGWRAGGAQPSKPGFAPEGKSFHQDQNFSDGFCGAAAVDLVARNGPNVHRAPRWSEVPAQGSAEAAKWGVHCNVGAPGQVGSEPWHIQPVEIDGWQTWWNEGRPSPKPNHPFPGRFPPPTPSPVPSPPAATAPIGALDMATIAHESGKDTFWFSPNGGLTRHAIRSPQHIRAIINAGAVDAVTGARLTLANWTGATVLTVAQLNDYLGKAA